MTEFQSERIGVDCLEINTLRDLQGYTPQRWSQMPLEVETPWGTGVVRDIILTTDGVVQLDVVPKEAA